MTDNNLAIIRTENVLTVAQSVPEVYRENSASRQRCEDFGRQLLAQVQQEGMTDQLDQMCATYVTKARNTVKAMNERRQAFTKLFDQMRSGFTSMEKSIDPATSGSVAFEVQKARNAYATAKREEQERLRREEMLRQQREQAFNRYQMDVEDEYKRAFNAYSDNATDRLTALNLAVTLDNYEEQCKAIKAFPVELPDDWDASYENTCTIPSVLFDVADRLKEARKAILSKLLPQFRGQYAAQVGDYRASIIDALPSRRAELERMAKASEEDRRRMEAEAKAREAAEAQRMEQERRRKEEEEAAKRRVQAEASEVSDLFAAQSVVTPSGYQPKTSVKRRIVFHSPDGVLAALSLWWSKEGQTLPVDELAKMFKKQVAFCEKLANDKAHPEIISSSAVSYEDEVKAK